MNKEAPDISKILPTGEMLRGFLEQPFLKKSDLKNILRNRGVFTFNTEKKDSIPILMSTTLSPIEFDNLRDSQNTREDNPKRITQVIPWDSKATILDALPEDMNVNSILDLEYSNYRVDGAPTFTPVDNNPDHLRMDFKIEREDHSKNWSSTKSTFPGSIEARRIVEKNEVKLVITHTANETKSTAKKAISHLEKHFKDEGHIAKNKEIQKITFDKFSNEKRIEFFLELSVEATSNILNFVEIVDLELSPDHEANLPDTMVWMHRKIDDLKLNGTNLHKTFFVNNKDMHEHIFLYRVDVCYDFDISGCTGQCVVTLHFPEYSKGKHTNSELEINIKTCSYSSSPLGITKNEVKEMILNDMESQKYEKFRDYLIGQTEAVPTPDRNTTLQPIAEL